MDLTPSTVLLRLIFGICCAFMLLGIPLDSRAQQLPLSPDLGPGELRDRMVREIESAEGITDERVLGALRAVPRHLFLEEDFVSLAYSDTYLPGPGGAVLPSPSLLASVLAETRPSRNSSVLIIGENTGYTAALYSQMASRVTCIELRTVLYERFESLFPELGYDNITLSTSTTLPEFIGGAPFDHVFVHGAVTELPEEIIAKSTTTGTVVFPLSLPGGFQILCVLKRNGSTFSLKSFRAGFFRILGFF